MRDVIYRAKKAAGWRCERCHHPTGCLSLGGARFRTYERACDAECDHAGDDGTGRLLMVIPLNGDDGTWRLWNQLVLCLTCAVVIEAQRRTLFASEGGFQPRVLLDVAPWLQRHLDRMNREIEREQRRDVLRRLAKIPKGFGAIDHALDVVAAAARRLGGDVTHHPREMAE